jgi:hypothetical protein
MGIAGESPVHGIAEIRLVTAVRPGPIIGVQKHLVLIRFHLVGGILGIQGKYPLCCIQYN